MNIEHEKEYTPAEMAAMKKATVEFYKERINVLKLQKEYETLLADIEEAKLRGLLAFMKVAHLKAGPESEEETNEETSETKE